MLSKKKKKSECSASDLPKLLAFHQDAVALKKMFSCITDVVMSLEVCNSLDKLLLTRIILQGGVTEETNSEIAKAVKKDPITISKTISKLQEYNLISSMGSSSKRMLAINDSVDTGLYNYSMLSIYKKDNKKNIIINNRSLAFSIRLNQIEGTVKAIHRNFYMYDTNDICKEFGLISGADWRKRIAQSSVGGVIRETLEQLISDNRISLSDQPTPETFVTDLTQGVVHLFYCKGLIDNEAISEAKKLNKEQLEAIEGETLREKNDRFLKRYLQKVWEEKVIEVSSDGQLQNISINECVKVTAFVDRHYVAGKPSLCNLNLTLINGDEIHAVIINKHYCEREQECHEFDGNYIEFEGKVVYNSHFKKKTIKSLSHHFPVKIINIGGQLNTKLKG